MDTYEEGSTYFELGDGGLDVRWIAGGETSEEHQHLSTAVLGHVTAISHEPCGS